MLPRKINVLECERCKAFQAERKTIRGVCKLLEAERDVFQRELKALRALEDQLRVWCALRTEDRTVFLVPTWVRPHLAILDELRADALRAEKKP